MLGCTQNSVFEGNVTVSENAHLLDIASYTRIVGDLTIKQDESFTREEEARFITSLNGLECLREVTGSLIIKDNPNII